MKARPLTLCLLTATFYVTSAFAQTGTKPAVTKPDGSGQMEKRRQELLKRFDRNGDGRLDETEKAALKEAQKKPGGLRGSGDIGSLGGARASGPGGEGRGDHPIREMIKRFDRDGDGKLDETELAEAEKARANFANNRTPGAPGARMREQMLKLFDKNGDGQLDQEERAAAEQYRADQTKRFDRNGDGQLDQEERAEAMRAFAAEHPELAPPPGR